MTLKTTLKNLRAIDTRTGVELRPCERRALSEAIAWLTGERRREVRADLRGRVLDHIDGNPRNAALSNLRVTTTAENNR